VKTEKNKRNKKVPGMKRKGQKKMRTLEKAREKCIKIAKR
jgi:hypothetical protein